MSWRRLLQLLGIVFLVMFIGLVVYSQTLMGVTPAWLWKDNFTDELRPVSKYIETPDRMLHYVDSGEVDKPVLLLVHGSPGQWTAFEDYFKDRSLREQFRIIALDRPGFGYSGNGDPELSVLEQARVIALILDIVPEDVPVILAGHSFGGPVVAQIAMTDPDRVDALVLLAGSSDPKLQIDKYIQYVARWPIVRWLVPPFAYSTNEEIFALRAELERMDSEWDKITAPTVIIHGDADTLVPIGNAEYSERMLVNAESVEVIRAETMNHFIVWNQYTTITNTFKELLQDSKIKE